MKCCLFNRFPCASFPPCTQLTYWVPAYVKEKRFHNWLESARDWAVSRSRFWGTPLPIWVSDDGEEIVCVGSVAELEELTGAKVGKVWGGVGHECECGCISESATTARRLFVWEVWPSWRS